MAKDTFEREFYAVEEIDGERVIHYHGFTWARPDSDGEYPWTATELTFCYIPLASVHDGNAEELAALAAESVTQYNYNFTDKEIALYIFKPEFSDLPVLLPWSEVSAETQCGEYWCPLG